MKHILLAVSAALFLSACATSPDPNRLIDEHIASDAWMKAVIEVRKQLRLHPDNLQLKARRVDIESRAAEYHYHTGARLLTGGDLHGAMGQFQQGLVATPDNAKLRRALQDTYDKNRANNYYQEAVANWLVGRREDTHVYLEKVFELDPNHQDASLFLKQIRTHEQVASESVLSPYSAQRISIDFEETDFKGAFEFIAESFQLNLIYDSDLDTVPVTVSAEDVSVLEALDLMVAATQTFYTNTGPNTILIAENTEEKRSEYEEYYIRTFSLKVAEAEETATILKEVLNLENVTVNKSMNAIVIRDKQSVIELAEQIIIANDRKPAELVLEVEILEVNREKTEQLGFDFGSQVEVNYPAFNAGDSWADALKGGRVFLPNMAFRYFKKDMDAKVLANPKIRVMDNREATLHVGDRIPFRSSSIIENTGQSRTEFEYRDVGIKLQVEPRIHLDNSASVKLNVEVSRLGQNLGTVSEPAWSVSTRNSQTEMMLRDGETAVLAGLIKDEDRKARIRVPGAGDIPALGALFTNTDDGNGRTDVLLTITPRIVRNWDVSATQSMAGVYSGSRYNFSTQKRYAGKKKPPIPGQPEFLLSHERRPLVPPSSNDVLRTQEKLLRVPSPELAPGLVPTEPQPQRWMHSTGGSLVPQKSTRQAEQPLAAPRVIQVPTVQPINPSWEERSGLSRPRTFPALDDASVEPSAPEAIRDLGDSLPNRPSGLDFQLGAPAQALPGGDTTLGVDGPATPRPVVRDADGDDSLVNWMGRYRGFSQDR